MSTSSTYSVRGMTCEHCVRAVSEEVSQLPGVLDVEIDLATGDVRVQSEGPLDLSEVATAVDEAGYELAGAPAG